MVGSTHRSKTGLTRLMVFPTSSVTEASGNTYIASNGAIEVKVVATNEVDFTKPGANGKGVWE